MTLARSCIQSDRRRILWLLFAAVIFAHFIRAPYLFFSPRMAGEEGSYFLSIAHNNGPLALMLTPYASYYMFWNSLIAALAFIMVPLEWAPAFTTLGALAIQLIPYAFILFGRLTLARRLGDKIALCAILLLAPLSNEVWLTTSNSQFYLSMGTALLLFEHTRRGPAREIWKRVYLTTAGLTSVTSCILAPAYLLKGWLRRERTTLMRGVLLSVCVAVQLSVLVYLYFNPHDHGGAVSYAAPGGRNLPSPAMLGGTLWVKSVGMTLFGEYLCCFSASYMIWAFEDGLTLKLTVYGIFFLILSLALPIAIFRLAGRRVWPTLLLAYLILTLVPSIVGIGPKIHYLNFGWHQRYYYVPNALLLIGAWFALKNSLRGSLIIRLAMVWCLCTGLLTGALWWRYRYGLPDRPDWQEEMKKWRADCTYHPRVWGPGVNFEVQFNCPDDPR